MSRMLRPMSEALKISAPDRDFAVESQAQCMGGAERSTEALGLWMSSSETESFNRLESCNPANL